MQKQLEQQHTTAEAFKAIVTCNLHQNQEATQKWSVAFTQQQRDLQTFQVQQHEQWKANAQQLDAVSSTMSSLHTHVAESTEAVYRQMADAAAAAQQQSETIRVEIFAQSQKTSEGIEQMMAFLQKSQAAAGSASASS